MCEKDRDGVEGILLELLPLEGGGWVGVEKQIR